MVSSPVDMIVVTVLPVTIRVLALIHPRMILRKEGLT